MMAVACDCDRQLQPALFGPGNTEYVHFVAILTYCVNKLGFQGRNLTQQSLVEYLTAGAVTASQAAGAYSPAAPCSHDQETHRDLGCGRGVTGVWQGGSRGAAGVRQGYGRGMAGVWQGCGRGVAGVHIEP